MFEIGEQVQIINRQGVYIPSSAEGQQGKIVSVYKKQSTTSYLVECFTRTGTINVWQPNPISKRSK